MSRVKLFYSLLFLLHFITLLHTLRLDSECLYFSLGVGIG